MSQDIIFIELQLYPKRHPAPPKQSAITQELPQQKALTPPDKKSAYTLTDFFTQKCNSALGKIASSVSAISMGTVLEALVAAALKEAFCRSIDHFFDTNFLEATQDFIEQHLDFWKTAASIALPILVGIGLIAFYIAYQAEKNHTHQKQPDYVIPAKAISI